jgi:transketolase
MEPEKKATRDGYGKGLVEAGKNKNVVALDADLSESTRSNKFAEAYPERFFEMGISEQDMVGTAGGLAASGKIPFASSFACFVTGRSFGQVRLMAAISNLNVRVVGSHAGLLTGEDGATHQALEDISLMRTLPNMTVIQPADAVEAEKAVLALVNHKGPAYLRLGRGKVPAIHDANYKFEIGKGEVLKKGNDAAIIATGALVHEALKAVEELDKQKISARVINIHTIKPIDKSIIIKAAKETKAIVTAEDHNIIGGLGSAVSEVLAENIPTPVERIGTKDVFGESGKPDELYKKYGLTSNDIIKAVKKVIGRKQR